jgi:hypothetical protein
MYKFSGFDKSLPNDFNSDYGIIKKIASEHGIQHVAVVDFVRLTPQNQLMNDGLQYREKGLHPVICTRKRFRKELKKISPGKVFVDAEHLTEIGTSIIAQEVYRFLLDEKWIALDND